MSKANPVDILSLRGGLNDADPPMALSSDSCVVAENVEFFNSTLGERRLGCATVSQSTDITIDPNITGVSWMGRHTPTADLGDAELWALGQSFAANNHYLVRQVLGNWETITETNPFDVEGGRGHQLDGLSLHGKFFIAGKTAVDELQVWDGSTLRSTGLPPPAAPVASDGGGVGTIAGTRYYRYRWATLSGSTVLLRSEPSAVTTFTPIGNQASVELAIPALAGRGETHWEVEASVDNANFYRLFRAATSQLTSNDFTPYGEYSTFGPISESLTSYTQLPSAKYLSADSDRLLLAGSWEDPAFGSRIWWTPVLGNTGAGNDERLDMTVNPYIDLDGYEGGEITGLSKALNGYMYAFKYSHIYKIVRQGQRTNAYVAYPLTKARGALPGSLVEAVDQSGNPAQYFLDPKVGPMRIGNYGLEWCGMDIGTLWARVNQSALNPAHGVFYQAKNQVHFWVALDGADYPNAKIIVHCSEMRSTENGARRGWVTVPVDDRVAVAHCSLMFSDNVDSLFPRNQTLVPFIGKSFWTADAVPVKSSLILRCDTGTNDAASSTTDTDAYYFAQIKTKPFMPTGLLGKHGAMAGTLVGAAVSDPANAIYVKLTKDFGAVPSTPKEISLIPKGQEDIVIRSLDNLNTSEMTALQLTFGDLNTNVTPNTNWELHAFSVKIDAEQTS